MADQQKPRFSVSVTPVVELGKEDNHNAPMTVLHEQIRKTLSGGGTVEINENDLNVSTTYVDGAASSLVSSNGSLIALDGDEDLVFIKHTGFLTGTTNKCADADTLKVNIDVSASSALSGTDTTIAELKSGEAIVLPRPSGDLDLAFASGTGNHVDVEYAVFGT